jgi:hypothetical protein
MLTAFLILWLSASLPLGILVGKFIAAGNSPALDCHSARAVHRSACVPLSGAPVGLVRGEG